MGIKRNFWKNLINRVTQLVHRSVKRPIVIAEADRRLAHACRATARQVKGVRPAPGLLAMLEFHAKAVLAGRGKPGELHAQAEAINTNAVGNDSPARHVHPRHKRVPGVA
jgi:hypothetical protein